MLEEGGSGRESSPTDLVLPDFVALHQPKLEEASNRQRRKRASPDNPPRPALDVQDLTGDKQPTSMFISQLQALMPKAHVLNASMHTGIPAQIARVGKCTEAYTESCKLPFHALQQLMTPMSANQTVQLCAGNV